MGSYAAFVWPAWGVTFAVVFGVLYFSLRDLRARQAELKSLEGALPDRAARRAAREGHTESGEQAP